MKNGFFKVGAATPSVKVADVDYNANEICRTIDECEKKGVALLAFPELSVTAYSCGDLFFHGALLEAAEKGLLSVVENTVGKDIVVVVGAPLVKSGKIYDCAVVVKDGTILGVVPKTNLAEYNECYEKRNFEAWKGGVSEIVIGGEEYPFGTLVFECANLPVFKFGVEFGGDLAAACPPSVKLAQNGANLVVCLAASCETVGKADFRRDSVKLQSAKLDCTYLYVSAGAEESTTDLVFSGHDIIAECGTVIAENDIFENGVTVTETDLEKAEFDRRKTFESKEDEDVLHVLFDLAVKETELTRKFAKNPFLPQNDGGKRAEEILNIQIQGLKKRATHVNAQSFVLGISGGLDSTLALLVAVKTADALGKPRSFVKAVSMPGFGTTVQTKTNAQKICEKLGVDFSVVPIAKAVKVHFEDIGQDENVHDVTYENAQARERTQILMDLANKNNGLVIGTGDLSELALGFATYNGDHMAMYGVNGSVPKTVIRYIVLHEADRTKDGELAKALRDIVETPVSPELLPDDGGKIAQKTEEIVGPYELHDFFLYYFMRWGYAPSKIMRLAKHVFNGEYDEKTIEKWLEKFLSRFFSQQFKRSCLPDGVKVGSVALSPRGDWKMPSDALATVWKEDLKK